MIPKIILQTSILKQPNYVVEEIKSKSNGWIYTNIKNKEFILFLKEFPIEEFSNSIEIFNSLENEYLKTEFFKFYFLYLKGGVYIDCNCMIEENIDLIIKNYSFCVFESYLNNNTISNNFMAFEPQHIIMQQMLSDMHNIDKDIFKKDPLFISKNLYKLVNNYKKTIHCLINDESKLFKLNIQFKIYKEQENEGKILHKNEKDEIIATSYIDDNYIKTSINTINDNIFECVEKTKIGITFDCSNDIKSLFSNGIRQNVLYFFDLLKNIGYDCYLIISDEKESCILELKKIALFENIKYVNYSDILSFNFNIIFLMGFDVEIRILKILKYMKTLIVRYSCGNSYFIDSEKILYSQHSIRGNYNFIDYNNSNLIDEIWSIPQMVNTNKYYWSTFYRTKCIEVPFIWSDKSISISAFIDNNSNVNDFLYKKHNGLDTKKIAVFEPNLSIMKWCLPALLVCENTYRLDKKIDKVFLTNINMSEKTNNEINNFNLDELNKIVRYLDLFSDKKISIETRFNTLFFMKNYADIAVSHQMENPLNYLYLDLAWMGWPIVHNAELCKDVGYYYEGFNYEMGSEILLDVILNHDKNSNEYLKKNREIITRYLPTNKELQNKYKILIENLYNK